MKIISINTGRRALATAIAIGCGLAAAPSALAGNLIPVSFDGLVGPAGSIVKVRVVNSESLATVGDDAANPDFVEQGETYLLFVHRGYTLTGAPTVGAPGVLRPVNGGRSGRHR